MAAIHRHSGLISCLTKRFQPAIELTAAADYKHAAAADRTEAALTDE